MQHNKNKIEEDTMVVEVIVQENGDGRRKEICDKDEWTMQNTNR